MSPRISPATTALLLATGVALPPAHADDLDDEVPPGLVAFEDSSRSAEAVELLADLAPASTSAALPAPESPAPSIPSTRAPTPAGPRFELSAGPYTSTRALRFEVSDFLAVDELPMVSPSATVIGWSVAGAAFPLAPRDGRGRLVGPGIGASLSRSLGATTELVDAEDDTAMLELPVVQQSHAIALRYRQPLGPALVEVAASHRTSIQRIDERPEWLEIPDVEYRSIAGEVRLELAVRGAAIGGYARWHHVLDAGELTSLEGYGSASVAAYDVGAVLDVPLGGALFVAAAIDYRQVTMQFAGDGELATLEGNDVPDVFGAVDRYVDARLALGARY